MKELSPKIKPKAPASLKENVLKAVREQEIAAPGRKKTPVAALRWLSAAAVLLVGILTFALWPTEKTAEVVAESHKTTPPAPLLADNAKPTPETRPEPVSTPSKPAPKAQKTEKAEPKAETADVGTVETPEEPVIAEIAPTEKQPESEPYTAEELELLAQLEAKRPLVNALLAEELAQANFQQRKIRQIQQESIQKYINMQQTIRQQIRESIENIGRQPENNVREV
ncbi:MAG: hypothetical protein IJ605_02110 [Prevotella sp.]|nr:hypothetical protein [Prevotella sp.]